MDIIDIILKAIPNWAGDAFHHWVDIVIKATPSGGVVSNFSFMAMAAASIFFIYAAWMHK